MDQILFHINDAFDSHQSHSVQFEGFS